MRPAGDSRTFIATAMILMAGLVITTMFSINATLQSALAPTSPFDSAPALSVVQSISVPRQLQIVAAPSLALPAPASSAAQPAPAALEAAAKPVVLAGAVAPKPAAVATLAAKADAPALVSAPAVTAPAAVPSVTLVSITPAAPSTAPTTAAAQPVYAPSSDIGDSTASSGIAGGGKGKGHSDVVVATPAGTQALQGPDSGSSGSGSSRSSAEHSNHRDHGRDHVEGDQRGGGDDND